MAGAPSPHLLKAGLQAARGHRVPASPLTEAQFRPIRDCCEKQEEIRDGGSCAWGGNPGGGEQAEGPAPDSYWVSVSVKVHRAWRAPLSPTASCRKEMLCICVIPEGVVGQG